MSLIEPIVGMAPRRRDEGSERRRALRFASLFTALFCASGLWKLHKGTSPRLATALVVLGVAFLFYALVHPAGVLALRRHWMRFAEALGRVNSVIILTLLYVLLVTPLGVLLRLFSRRRNDANPASYFVARREQRDAKHFEHPY